VASKKLLTGIYSGKWVGGWLGEETLGKLHTEVDSNGLLHSSFHVILLRRLAEEHIHRERAPGNVEDGRARKEVGELGRVQRR